MTGAFVAVVGPSGAGKDAVIGAVRQQLGADAGVRFPRRVITRPAGAGEDHEPSTPAVFAEREQRAGFAVAWDAHGLRYGIDADVAVHVDAGGVAVLNVSRSVLDLLRARFARTVVVRITAPAAVRLARIAARGREDAADAQARIRRVDPAPDHPVDLEIVNDGSLTDAAAPLLALLRTLSPAALSTSERILPSRP